MGQTLPQPLKSGPGPQRGPRGQHHRSLDSVQRAVHGGGKYSWGGRTCRAPVWCGSEWECGRPGLLREEKFKESSLKILSCLYSFSGRRKEKKTNALMTSFSKI